MNMNDYRKVTDRIYPSGKCREEVMNMRNENSRKKIKHRYTGKAVAAIAVAVVAACGKLASEIRKPPRGGLSHHTRPCQTMIGM